MDKVTTIRFPPTPVGGHEKLAVRGKLVRTGGRKQVGLVLEPHGAKVPLTVGQEHASSCGYTTPLAL